MRRRKAKQTSPNVEEPEPKHIVFQPVVKPGLREVDLVQPIQAEKYTPRPQQIDVIPPYAVRLKAKGLLER